MSMPAEQPRRYSLEEYFALEASSPDIKYEFRDGVIVNMREAMAMAGGSIPHSLISANTLGAIGMALKGKPCRAYSSDLRVRIPRKVLYTYPDVTVVCGEPEIETVSGVGDTLANPKVIVEVLSPSTEAYDRGTKMNRYMEIASLQEYVLVSQDEPSVNIFRRRDDGTWLVAWSSGMDAVARFSSIDVTIALSEIYAGVEFPRDKVALR